MPFELTDLAGLRAAGFDTIIDVRSPAEFAEDHLPGAVNMPVLNDKERARIGTIYIQENPFKARKIGAALVARAAAEHIETSLLDKPGGWRPLVYCWRGGQRSGSFATILEQIGWRVETLQGGYQSWRRLAVRSLYDGTLPHRLIRLDGFTGTGKTALLTAVEDLGGQVIDLEGLARHRGSILGDVVGPQPSQKAFETALLSRIAYLDPERPVLVEAESARIGDLRLPPAIWSAMKDSPRIVIEAPIGARAAYLAGTYADLAADKEGFTTRLNGLRSNAGHSTVESWLAMLAKGQLKELAKALIEQHYDPAYARLRRADSGRVLMHLDTENFDADTRRAMAARIVEGLGAV